MDSPRLKTKLPVWIGDSGGGRSSVFTDGLKSFPKPRVGLKLPHTRRIPLINNARRFAITFFLILSECFSHPSRTAIANIPCPLRRDRLHQPLRTWAWGFPAQASRNRLKYGPKAYKSGWHRRPPSSHHRYRCCYPYYLPESIVALGPYLSCSVALQRRARA